MCRMAHEVFCELVERDGDVGVKRVNGALFRLSKVPFMGHICLHENIEKVFVKHDRSMSKEARLVQVVISLTLIMGVFCAGVTVRPTFMQTGVVKGTLC
jgi:hypothetical protein